MKHFCAVIIKAHRFYIILIPPTVSEIDIEICNVHAGLAHAVPKLHEKIIVACAESDIVAEKRVRVVCLYISYLAVVETFHDCVSVYDGFGYQVVTARSLCVDFVVVPTAAPALGNGKVECFSAEVYIHEVGVLFLARKLR